MDVMNFPEEFTCCNGRKSYAVESICIFFKRLAYGCRYLNMVPKIARPVPQLCMVSNLVMDYVYTHWNHSLSTLNQPWLSLDNLERFANATFQKSGALQKSNQRTLYNSHKKVCVIKCQSAAVPNDLVANLYATKWEFVVYLWWSRLSPPLTPIGSFTPFKGAGITQDERSWNSTMSRSVSCQWSGFLVT